MLIYGVSFDLVGKQPIVLLKTADGNKFLPIWIGHPEAAAILMKLQSQAPPRPMTHDLLSDMLEQLEAQVVRITVTELRENTFYAQITVQQDGREIEVDSRPSDAIALAIRAEAPIFAADRVIEESAIEFEGEEVDEEQLEAEVQKFKSFLDDVTPEDFAVENGDDEELRQHRECERGAVEQRVHDHPGVDALGPVTDVREHDAERDEHEQRLQEPVGRAERDADKEDRRPPSEEPQERLAEPAERELLDERRDYRQERDVGRERRCVLRLPAGGCQPLLVARALRERDQRDECGHGVDRGDRAGAPGGAATPRLRPPQREQLGVVECDREHEAEPDAVDDHAARESRPAVDRVAGGPGGARAREPRVVVQTRDERDEGRPAGETTPVHARFHRRIGLQSCATSLRRRRTPRSPR
jgi:bifunctional DNase/RNase